MQDIILKGVMGTMLLISAVQDILKKKICLWVIAAGAALTLGCLILRRPVSLWDAFGGALVGVSVIVISKASGDKIGMGDGLLLCVTGLGLGFWKNMELFAYALLAAAIVSIILLTFRLADRKKSIPFVPFLMLGYLLLIVIYN